MSPAAPTVDCDRLHPGLPVPDVAAAVDFYTNKLGFTRAFTWPDDAPPTFAGVNLGQVQVFLERREAPADGAMVAFVVGDADELLAFHQAQGVAILEPIADREYGVRDYMVRDLAGNRLSFGHYIYNQCEPVTIERVDVPLRLEKRLAALLHDLARHKRMSLSGVFEEMILHTNDGVGPHTEATVRHIQQLKRKHGIDFDSHASYRWIEKGAPS